MKKLLEGKTPANEIKENLIEEIKKLKKESITFSRFTFPHGLFRGILLEQIYRSFKIINHETYHK